MDDTPWKIGPLACLDSAPLSSQDQNVRSWAASAYLASTPPPKAAMATMRPSDTRSRIVVAKRTEMKVEMGGKPT